MKILLYKFGTLLNSRQLGKEAFSAYTPVLNMIPEGEIIEVDFEGVVTFSPSWGDEFLTPLVEKYGEGVVFMHTQNPSVQATLKLLRTIKNIQFKILS